MIRDTDWYDSSARSYTSESVDIGHHTVTVCHDDEGPMGPAFYWDIVDMNTGDKITDGWARSPEQARIDALQAQEALP